MTSTSPKQLTKLEILKFHLVSKAESIQNRAEIRKRAIKNWSEAIKTLHQSIRTWMEPLEREGLVSFCNTQVEMNENPGTRNVEKYCVPLLKITITHVGDIFLVPGKLFSEKPDTGTDEATITMDFEGEAVAHFNCKSLHKHEWALHTSKIKKHEIDFEHLAEVLLGVAKTKS